ncbi:MAG: hypothetical protein ACOY3Y_20360 [Acidobacteriota bacterium]
MSRLAPIVIFAQLAVAACDQTRDLRLGEDAGGRTDQRRRSWTVGVGGPGADGVGAIAIAPDGDLVVAGEFSGTARIGDRTLFATHVSGAGAFVAKLAHGGEVRWVTALEAAARMRGDLHDRHCLLHEVAVGPDGNIFATAHIAGTARVAGRELTAIGECDGLIVKLSASGEVLRAWSFGGTREDLVQGLVVDATGAITASGRFQGEAVFGDRKLAAGGTGDGFVMRLDPAGGISWVVPLGSESPDSEGVTSRWEHTFGLALDGEGSCYAAGKFVAAAKFGSVVLESNPSIGLGGYLAKLDGGGTVVNANAIATVSMPGPRRLALDPRGKILLTGWIVTSQGGDHPFLAAIDSTSLAWSFPWVGEAGYTTDVEVRGGALAIAGTHSSRMTLGAKTLTTAGGHDAFVARLDGSYRFIGAASAGGPGDDGANGVAIDPAGSLYVVGWFSETATFGDTTLTSAGDHDGYVWKIPAPEP